MGRQGNRGFTLLEVMIVCVIVGILAAIVLPAYQDQVRKSRRASRNRILWRSRRRSMVFPGTRSSSSTSLSTLNVTTPADVSSNYTISIATAAGPPATFTATATPTGGQVNDLGTGVNLTIDSTGNKAPGWQMVTFP